MLETLDIVSDATLVAELQQLPQRAAAGDVLTTDDVLADLPARTSPAKHLQGWKSGTWPVGPPEQWSSAVGVAAVLEETTWMWTSSSSIRWVKLGRSPVAPSEAQRRERPQHLTDSLRILGERSTQG